MRVNCNTFKTRWSIFKLTMKLKLWGIDGFPKGFIKAVKKLFDRTPMWAEFG